MDSPAVTRCLADLSGSLELVVQMSVNPKRDAYFIQAATAQDLDRLGDVLQIFLRRALRPPPAQIGLLVIASKFLLARFGLFCNRDSSIYTNGHTWKLARI